jgi:hypothetical protein
MTLRGPEKGVILPTEGPPALKRGPYHGESDDSYVMYVGGIQLACEEVKRCDVVHTATTRRVP